MGAFVGIKQWRTRTTASADRTARRESHACICFYDIQRKRIRGIPFIL